MNRLALLASTALLGLSCLLVAPPARAGAVADRVKARGELRVCIWPQYYGISLRDARTGALRGLDVDLSAAFAADLGFAATRCGRALHPGLVDPSAGPALSAWCDGSEAALAPYIDGLARAGGSRVG